MGWGEALYTLLTRSFIVLAWPPFSLLCPLFISVRAMESGSRSSNQRCLIFWVLFSLSMIMEWGLSVLFNSLPWWPHMKSIATILLLIPYVGAAPYIYKFLIRHYCTWNLFTRISNIFSQKSTHFESDEDSELVDVSDQTITTSQIQEKKLEAYQEIDDLAGCDKTECSYKRLSGIKLVQKEWSCALCQISTTSEHCLRAHLKGKKHKAKEEELRVEFHATNSNKRINGMVLLRNLNQIANILNPVSRSMRWCKWRKPEFGWTKLNTDGSIHKETASFGGLLRDYRGTPICAFVSKAPQGDVFLVELWAIWRGLVLSLGLGIKAIWVESDSMSVVKTVNRKQLCPKADSYLKQIWKLLKKFDKYKISHSWRETNRAADHLAKMDLWGNDVVLWPVDFPPSLFSIIKDDAKGKKYLRR
ncbi:HVA22 protein a [Spatholobus suberectus]|nr:HVA22 protein a [Spatholobus suberectus]